MGGNEVIGIFESVCFNNFDSVFLCGWYVDFEGLESGCLIDGVVVRYWYMFG